MPYKAIFFDRDNTLTHMNPEKRKWLKESIKSWSGKDYQLDYDTMIELFDKAGYPKTGLKSVEEEKVFFRRYYQELLQHFGVNYMLDDRAEQLLNELWCNNAHLLFDDVIEVLEYFKNNGYKMGVISDTSPSLQLTLEQLDLGKYFDSYICSDLAGAMKPDPKIYNIALESIGVKASESIYVDDLEIEADGARNLGFLAFHIDRKGEKKSEWTISSLKQIIEYIEQ